MAYLKRDGWITNPNATKRYYPQKCRKTAKRAKGSHSWQMRVLLVSCHRSASRLLQDSDRLPDRDSFPNRHSNQSHVRFLISTCSDFVGLQLTDS